MSNTPLSVALEAILFYHGGSVSLKELAAAAEVSVDDVEAALAELRAALAVRGLTLVRERDRVALGTSPQAFAVIERMRRDELEGPVGRAGLETLAVIIYRGQVSRADIEYIRGVNASAILRTLLIRGLVERVENPTDKRSFLYRASPELPAYFGVATLAELPEFAEITEELAGVFTERDAVVTAEEPHE